MDFSSDADKEAKKLEDKWESERKDVLGAHTMIGGKGCSICGGITQNHHDLKVHVLHRIAEVQEWGPKG